MIKRLFKLIFGLILFIVLLVGGLVAFLYFSIRDKNNDIPYHLYNDQITFKSEMENVLYSSLDKMSQSNQINVALNEDDLNKIIFGVLRDKYPKYLPLDSCSSLECRVIEGQEINLPLLGKKELAVKGAYAKYVKDDIRIFAVLDLAGIPSTVNMTINFTEKDGVYKLQINRLALGKLNILSGIGKMFLEPVLSAAGFSSSKINSNLQAKNIPVVFDSKAVSFSFKKEDISTVISNLVNKEGETPTDENAMLMSLIDVLANNDLVNLGFFTENEKQNFGIRLALEKLKVDPSRESLPNNVSSSFNTETFIKNKTQSFIFTNLATDPKLSFTNLDFNRIIYDKTNAYSDFKYNFPLPNGKNFTISVDGILISFHQEEVNIEIIININNLITIMKLSGEVSGNNTNEVKIKITETITLGEDKDEKLADFVSTNDLYLLNLIGDGLGGLDIIKYDKTTHTLILDTDSFNAMMNVGSNNENPLATAEKINIKEGLIEIKITYTDPALASVINNVSNLVNDFLENNSITADNFNTTNPEQAAAVNNLINSLDDISNDLNGGNELTPEQIDSLINDINNLDEENLNTLINNIQDDVNDPQLSELYDLLFGQVNP